MHRRNNILIFLSNLIVLCAILSISEPVCSKGLQNDTVYYPDMITLDYPFMDEIARYVHLTSEIEDISADINIPKKECYYYLTVRDLNGHPKDNFKNINFIENGSYAVSLAHMITLTGVEMGNQYTFTISGVRFLTHFNLKEYFVGCKVKKSLFVFPSAFDFCRFFEFEIRSGKIVKATYIYEENSCESTTYDLINKKIIK